jgi:hypothetical protein
VSGGAEAVDEVDALDVRVLSQNEERTGWSVLSAKVVDRWSPAAGLEYIVAVAVVRAPSGRTVKRASLLFTTGGRRPFFMWLRGEDTIRRAAEALLAASRA